MKKAKLFKQTAVLTTGVIEVQVLALGVIGGIVSHASMIPQVLKNLDQLYIAS